MARKEITMAGQDDREEPRGLTRRALLTRSTGLAAGVGASAVLPGCAAVLAWVAQTVSDDRLTGGAPVLVS